MVKRYKSRIKCLLSKIISRISDSNMLVDQNIWVRDMETLKYCSTEESIFCKMKFI